MLCHICWSDKHWPQGCRKQQPIHDVAAYLAIEAYLKLPPPPPYVQNSQIGSIAVQMHREGYRSNGECVCVCWRGRGGDHAFLVSLAEGCQVSCQISYQEIQVHGGQQGQV